MQHFFEEYSMPLKYLITSSKWDPNVLNDPKRGDSRVERTMGILWDVLEDTVLARPANNYSPTCSLACPSKTYCKTR